MDKNHNPEFTMLEFYCAYSDVYNMLDFTEEMIKVVFHKIKGSKTIEFANNVISIENNFEVIDFFESIKKFSNKDVSNMKSKELLDFLKDSKVKVEKDANYGNLIDKIFSPFTDAFEGLTSIDGIKKAEIETGTRNLGNLEILNGLVQGDKIIAEGLTKVRPGMKVKPINKSQ